MRTNTKQPIAKQLFFVLLLLPISVTSQNCQSFSEVYDFDIETAVLSAPGFVENLTLPSSSMVLPLEWVMTHHENATGTVTEFSPKHGKTVAKPRFLEFDKPMTVRLPGMGGAGYNVKESSDFDDFMHYLADGGSGFVIELENHSTLELYLDRNETTYTAEPMKLFKKTGSKVALAVLHEVEMKITIPSANVLSISMDREMAEDNFMWMATEGFVLGRGMLPMNMTMGPNQCLELTPATLHVPTSSPTQRSGANARRSGFTAAACTMLAVAALVALW